MNYFYDIKDLQLQAYNRLMYVKALQEDCGAGAAEDYLKKVSKEDQLLMAQTLVAIKKVGEPAFKRGLTKHLEVV